MIQSPMHARRYAMVSCNGTLIAVNGCKEMKQWKSEKGHHDGHHEYLRKNTRLPHHDTRDNLCIKIHKYFQNYKTPYLEHCYKKAQRRDESWCKIVWSPNLKHTCSLINRINHKKCQLLSIISLLQTCILLCYGARFTLSAREPSSYVRIWRLQTSDSDV